MNLRVSQTHEASLSVYQIVQFIMQQPINLRENMK